MNKAISFFGIVGVLAISQFIISCGPKNDNNSNNTVQACATGYYFYNNTCQPIGGGGGSQQPGFLYTNGFYADNHSGTAALRMTNAALMQEFFQQGMGVCNRAGVNIGNARCDAYSSGYLDVIIQFPSVQTNTLLATFIAYPRQSSNWFNYGGQLPSGRGLLGLALGWATGIYLPDPKAYYGAVKNPLQLEMQVSAINNSTGFEARGYGDAWTGYNRTLIAIQIPTGKVSDPGFNFKLNIQNKTAAEGTMNRCRYQNCNLY